ncbi:MAG: SGNH/GDSL hydrolase family protein [Planctomycetia bacterium]|nr:SGNH/GDSL hydrolase family protein [Planctomycetia bacterium]
MDAPSVVENKGHARAPGAHRTLAFRLAALTLSITVGLLLAEAGLRIGGYSPTYVNALGSFHEADPVSGHRGKRNFSARFKMAGFDVVVAHDERGFRRQEHQNPSAARKLCCFGDSFVWGWGVAQGEVFTDQLSLMLPERRVENYGINATGTVAQYELFAAECRDGLAPGDVVLLTFCQNDFADNVSGSRRAEVRDGHVTVLPACSHLRPSWKRTLQQSSYLFNYLSYLGNRLQLGIKHARDARQAAKIAAAAQAATEKGSPESGGEAANEAQPAAAAAGTKAAAATASESPPPIPGDAVAEVAIVKYCLAKWKHDCDEHGIRFIVAYIPGMVELQETAGEPAASHERAFRHAFFACADSLSIETLDLLPGMLAAKRAGGIDRLGIPGDGHWNAAGHRVVAGMVAARLADKSMARRPE